MSPGMVTQTSQHGGGIALCTVMQRCPMLIEPELNVSTDTTTEINKP